MVQPSNNQFHDELSSGTLGIEISACGEKIITNCGGSEIEGKNPTTLSIVRHTQL